MSSLQLVDWNSRECPCVSLSPCGLTAWLHWDLLTAWQLLTSPRALVKDTSVKNCKNSYDLGQKSGSIIPPHFLVKNNLKIRPTHIQGKEIALGSMLRGGPLWEPPRLISNTIFFNNSDIVIEFVIFLNHISSSSYSKSLQGI